MTEVHLYRTFRPQSPFPHFYGIYTVHFTHRAPLQQFYGIYTVHPAHRAQFQHFYGIYTVHFTHRAPLQQFYGIYTVHPAHRAPLSQPNSTFQPNYIQHFFLCSKNAGMVYCRLAKFKTLFKMNPKHHRIRFFELTLYRNI